LVDEDLFRGWGNEWVIYGGVDEFGHRSLEFGHGFLDLEFGHRFLNLEFGHRVLELDIELKVARFRDRDNGIRAERQSPGPLDHEKPNGGQRQGDD
jgi:hypothetical protein